MGLPTLWALFFSVQAEVSVFEYIPEEEQTAIRGYNSTADLSPYVETALRALPARGENLLRFPCGLYHFSVVLPAGNVTLRGCGNKVALKTERAAILRPAPQEEGSRPKRPFIIRGDRKNYVRIEGFAVEGMDRVQSAFFFANGIDVTVNNNYFYRIDEGDAAIRGGGLLFFRSRGNTFSMKGFAYDLQDRYAFDPSKTYYGVNVGWIEENVISAANGARLGGTVYFSKNDLEMGVDTPARAALEICEPTANGHYTLRGNYFELKKGTAEPLTAILACNPKVSAVDNVIYGDHSAGSIAINLKADYVYSATVQGNSINRVETGIRFLGTESGGSSSEITTNTFHHVEQWIENAGGKGLFFDETGWEFQDASVRFGLRRIGPADPLDLSRGNLFQVDTEGGVLAEIRGAKPGLLFLLFFAGESELNPSLFQLCGPSRFEAGESALFFTDDWGEIREVCRREKLPAEEDHQTAPRKQSRAWGEVEQAAESEQPLRTSPSSKPRQ